MADTGEAWRATQYEALRKEYHVYDASESSLQLTGGGDFYDNNGAEPSSETRQVAEDIAEKLGMHITGAHGEWYGYSEYTPDPGDVSIFEWEPK